MHGYRASAMIAFLIAAAAGAESANDTSHWRGDLIYSLSGRSAETRQGDFTASFGGFAPSYLRLDTAWFTGTRRPGWLVDLRVERFRVSGDGPAQGDVSAMVMPFSATVAAASEIFPFPWLRLEAAAGYGLAAVPSAVFKGDRTGGIETPLLAYHGPVLAMAGTATIRGPHFAEVRVSTLPYPVGGVLAGLDARAAHVSLGLRGGLAGFRFANLNFVGMLEYEAHRVVGGTVDGSTTLATTDHRIGLGLRVTSAGVSPALIAPPGGAGRIRGRVFAAVTREPIAGAEVVVPDRSAIRSNRSGEFVIPDVGPGPVSFEVRVAGFRVASETVQVQTGADVHHSLHMVRRTGAGRIVGKVFTRSETGAAAAPIAGAEIRTQTGVTVASAADGSFSIDKAGPGAVALVVNARNHDAAEEVVSVPAEADAEVQILLEKSAARSHASIRGQVRSANGGEPIRATLAIREAKVNTRADRDGRFNVRVPGGRYRLQISARGYLSQTKIVDLADGDQALFYIDLSPGAP